MEDKNNKLMCNLAMIDAICHIQGKAMGADTIARVILDRVADKKMHDVSPAIQEIYNLCFILLDYTAATNAQLDALCGAPIIK